MKGLLIVLLITTVLIGALYLFIGEEFQENSSTVVWKIFLYLWGSCFTTLWIGYRVLFKGAKYRSLTNDMIYGKDK